MFCEFHPIAGPKIAYQVRCTVRFGQTLCQTLTDRQTDRLTDRQTNRQTDGICTFTVQASFAMGSLERFCLEVHAVLRVSRVSLYSGLSAFKDGAYFC